MDNKNYKMSFKNYQNKSVYERNCNWLFLKEFKQNEA